MQPLETAFTIAHVISVLLAGSVGGQIPSFYCNQNGSVINISRETGDIYTLYNGDTVYQNNQKCEWVIDAGAGHRVEITVISSVLQWAPASAICPGYDHVSIKDVFSDSSEADGGISGGKESIVLIWCGNTVPLGAVSRGRYMRVEFMSDKNNPYQYTGVHLKFQIFASTECPPSWAAPLGGNVCFKLLDKAGDWSSAQRVCNAAYSNLASFSSEEEFSFVSQAYEDAYGLIAWIGLNDITSPGSYRWIDETELAVNRFPSGHHSDEFKRCVALHFTSQDWHIHDCLGFIAKPLCKANKGRETKLFPIPQENEDENDVPTKHLIGIVIGVVLLVILLIITCFMYRHFKKQCNRRSTYRQPKSRAETGGSQIPNHDSLQGAAGGRVRGSMTEISGGGKRSTESGQQPCDPAPLHPSAPPPDSGDAPSVMNPSLQMIAPPTYQEALLHPVVGSRV